MKATIYAGPVEVRPEQRPDPTIEAAGDVVVRASMTTICGSDLHIPHGTMQVETGAPIGHEYVGVVESVGAGASRVKVGDRVTGPANP
jgi:glutathione-independent formaldehyde dehydrogenase